MYCAICWDFFCNNTTIIISDLILYLSESHYSKNVLYFYGFTIKAFKSRKESAGNQRYSKIPFKIVRTLLSQVGTSETTRVATNSKKETDRKFNEWLAGVIDGDGCFLLSKSKYASLEITMGLEDLPLLRYIQDKLGGSVKQRSGAKAFRYRLHNREGVLDVLHRTNGNIHNSVRIIQFHRLCQHFNIPVQESVELTKENY